MPRVAKAAKGGAKKPAAKKNGYVKSEKIPLGEVFTGVSREQWKIGPVIGSGGFGDIYCACKAGSGKKKTEDYDCVIKIEPHGNGPLFVEMHFYMRNAKLDDIKAFCGKRKIKSIGMPYIIGSGSHDLNDKKHRFLVMPRYGKDVWSCYLENKKKLPQHTVYRLAIQMLDVYDYIHNGSYVHADLKGANILLEYPGKSPAQAYLVDFGLASHYTTKDYKPDPRKMHNGTIEYTSRDAHNGVPTMRGDFEILGYNLIQWSGVELPWETAKLLAQPIKVQQAKEEFIKDVNAALNKLFDKNAPAPIKQFMEYVQSLEYNETPDYEKCRKQFHAGLKALNKTNSGPLDMTFDAKSPGKKAPKRPAADSESESDDNNKLSPAKSRARINKTPIATTSKRRNSPRVDTTPVSRAKPDTPSNGTAPGSARKRAANPSPKLKITPSLVQSTGSSTRPGKTIINDTITPNPQSNKTYKFSLELDVSFDANVIVNVKRKKKAPDTEPTNDDNKVETVDNSSDTEIPPSPADSPVRSVRVRKLQTTPSQKSTTVKSTRAASRRVN